MKTEFLSCIESLIWFQNVSHYEYVEENETIYAWKITYETQKTPTDTNVPVYFILDSMNHAAFSHWVYESSTWLPFFQEIKRQYPSCKIVFDGLKEYKTLFLKLYDLPTDSICLRSQLEPTNYCLFHPYTSLNDKQIPVSFYTNLLQYKSTLDRFHAEKNIPLLYLPRGRKENLQGPNNRTYNIQDDLKQIVTQLGGVVYETDTTTSLEDQILLVKRAKCILLDYGSNLWVNGLFATGSHIVCLNIGWRHHELFPSLKTIWDMIHRTNTVKQIFAYGSQNTSSESTPVVCFHMNDILQELHSRSYTDRR